MRGRGGGHRGQSGRIAVSTVHLPEQTTAGAKARVRHCPEAPKMRLVRVTKQLRTLMGTQWEGQGTVGNWIHGYWGTPAPQMRATKGVSGLYVDNKAAGLCSFTWDKPN